MAVVRRVVTATDPEGRSYFLPGEIYACTDAGEVPLGPGDVLIQRGTNHTWHNSGPETCVFASVMVSAEPLPSPEERR